MAVTDLTDSLPYWARQGVGYPGGPGPTGGPGTAPQGAGNSASWLQYLMQMFGPGAAQAAQDSGHGDGDNPPVPPTPVPPAPVPTPQNGPSILPQARGVANPPFPPSAGPSILPQARGVAVPPGPMAPGSTTMPAGAAPSAANPLAVAGPGAAGPVPGPLASGGATAAGASANPRFIGIAAPNMSPQNSMRGGPQGTALNLAGLFGGAPGAPRGVNPANLPAPNAQTVSGPLAQGGAPSGDDWNIDANGNVVPNYDTTSNAPWKYGPLQKGNIWKTSGGPHR
jgi:hypothetical protein